MKELTEKQVQDITDLSCRIVSELVNNELIKDCTDTHYNNEWEAQDIIFEHIKKFINN